MKTATVTAPSAGSQRAKRTSGRRQMSIEARATAIQPKLKKPSATSAVDAALVHREDADEGARDAGGDPDRHVQPGEPGAAQTAEGGEEGCQARGRR